MFIGRPISVAAAPDASNSDKSAASTSGGTHRRIIPMGRLTRPVGVVVAVSDFVVFGRLFGALGGSTIR
jgi:hypothetical protein